MIPLEIIPWNSKQLPIALYRGCISHADAAATLPGQLGVVSSRSGILRLEALARIRSSSTYAVASQRM